MSDAFLDTNVIIRYLVDDDPDRSQRASRLLGEIAVGEMVVHISETVLFETVYTLEKTYGLSRDAIAQSLLALTSLPGIQIEHKAWVPATFDLYTQQRALSFGDCHHITIMKRLDLSQIISFDRGFDRVADVSRIEP